MFCRNQVLSSMIDTLRVFHRRSVCAAFEILESKTAFGFQKSEGPCRLVSQANKKVLSENSRVLSPSFQHRRPYGAQPLST